MYELRSFGEVLVKRPILLVTSKVDACQDETRIESVRAKASEHGLPFYTISSATGENTDVLKFAISERVLAAKEDG